MRFDTTAFNFVLSPDENYYPIRGNTLRQIHIRISEFGASRYIIAHPTEQTEIVASVAV